MFPPIEPVKVSSAVVRLLRGHPAEPYQMFQLPFHLSALFQLAPVETEGLFPLGRFHLAPLTAPGCLRAPPTFFASVV